MKEQKHTPGPWEADCRTGCFAVRRNGDKLNCLSEASRDSIVFQNGRSEELSEPNGYRYLTDEQIANARLIAAAPELLAELMNYCAECCGNGAERCPDYNVSGDMCRWAKSGKCGTWITICKATGHDPATPWEVTK